MIDINIDDLGIEYHDSGLWRSYGFETHGETMEELWDNATVFETDQDGGELDCYGAGEAATDVYEAVEKIIKTKYITSEVLKVWRVG